MRREKIGEKRRQRTGHVEKILKKREERRGKE